MGAGEFDVEQTVGLLRSAASAMRSVTTCPADEVRAIHRAVNALQAREADLLAVMEQTKAHETDGAASIKTWAVRELGQDPGTTRQLVAASRTMRDLPMFGRAARAGELSFAHVNAMTFGLKHVGQEEITGVEAELLTVASGSTPAEVFTAMRRLKAVVHDDDLDEAWLRGMDKEDIQCVQVGDGFQVKGFRGIDAGAKFRVLLRSWSVPRDADDTRTAAQRRSDGFDDMVSRELQAGLPAEGNVKPHISVIVNAQTLKNTMNGTSSQSELDLDAEPAVLEGFGPIGPALLTYLVCGGDLTPILVEGFTSTLSSRP